MTKPTICLASMVRNESRIVQRMLSSAAPYIDRWCVLDTGSDDGTQAIIEGFFEYQETPGTLHEEPFVDFAYSRNRLLELARKEGCDYLLLLDADHILHVEDGALADLSADSYLIELRGGNLSYHMPYLLRSGIKAAYHCPTHEFLGFDEPFLQIPIEGVWLDHLEDGGTRHEKFERDEKLLEQEFAKDPNDQRTVFYLAQTIEHKDPERAKQLYQRRYDLGGWDEERYVSLVRLAVLTNETADIFRAWSFRPTRWEAATALIKRLHETGDAAAGYLIGSSMLRDVPRPSTDYLFRDTSAETWAFNLEFGLAAFYAGHPDVAKTVWTELLEWDDVPENVRELTERNLNFC